MNDKKIFCGNGKKIQGHEGIKVSVNLSKLPKEHIKDSKTGDKWINLVMWPTKDDKYGNDYSLSVDTYEKKEEPAKQERLSKDQLPF